MQEIETKILEIDPDSIAKKLDELGAEKIQDVILKVDWFSLPNLIKENHPWYLRVRSYSSGKTEITWKGKPETIGTVRKVEEINVLVDDPEKTKMLFEALDLVCYAHQEKKRVSWKFGNVQFDMDTYPNMPTYLEIEAENEKEIVDMIKKLDLQKFQIWNNGEKKLILEKYRLNWYDMRF
ncbi:MAG: CYTH domain-containing protein [Candidatus Paceibacterota bacterium]